MRTGVWNEVGPEARDNEVEDPGCRFRRPFFGSFFGRTKKEHKRYGEQELLGYAEIDEKVRIFIVKTCR